VNLEASSNYTLSSPRELTANYTYRVESFASSYQLSLHIIQPFAYVHLEDAMISTSPIALSDVPPMKLINYQTAFDGMGNTVLTMNFQSQNSSYLGGDFYVTVLQHFTAYAISYDVNPLKVGVYDTNSSLYRLYTSAVPYIESNNTEIVAKAMEIAGGDTNPYRVAWKIQNWVVSHMTYDSTYRPWSPATEGALFALHSGRGVCRHYAALFTALARADGIPTAFLEGSGLSDNGSVLDRGDRKHTWVQFFLPNYGWVSADPTWAEFAQLDNNHVPILSEPYDTLDTAWSSTKSTTPGLFNSLTPIFSSTVVNDNFGEPVISLGLQVAEFPATAPLTLMLVIAVTLCSTRREVRTRKK
jgi:hypothetical protein